MMSHKIIAIILIAFCLASCSSEKTKIKRALKESVGMELAKDYKFKSYQIVSTQLRSSITDSIAGLRTSVDYLDMKMKREQSNIESYKDNIRDCKRSQRSTMYWLRSSYDYIIREWEEMLEKEVTARQNDSIQLDINKKKIDFYKQNLDATDSPIIFYVVKHDYTLRGAARQEKVMLDANYQLTHFDI